MRSRLPESEVGNRPVNGSAGGPSQTAGERPQMLDELGRLSDLELDRDHRKPHREPPEVVVADPSSQLRASFSSTVPQYAGTRAATSSAGRGS